MPPNTDENLELLNVILEDRPSMKPIIVVPEPVEKTIFETISPSYIYLGIVIVLMVAFFISFSRTKTLAIKHWVIMGLTSVLFGFGVTILELSPSFGLPSLVLAIGGVGFLLLENY